MKLICDGINRNSNIIIALQEIYLVTRNNTPIPNNISATPLAILMKRQTGSMSSS
jgi:hypothetical protein